MLKDSEAFLDPPDLLGQQDSGVNQGNGEMKVHKDPQEKRERGVQVEVLVAKALRVNQAQWDQREDLDWMVQEEHQYVNWLL